MGRCATKWNCVAVVLLCGLLRAQSPRPLVQKFTLEDPTGRIVTYSASESKATIVIFASTRCPISNAFNSRINSLYNEFRDKTRFLVVDSNVNESAREVQAHAREMQYDFPVYLDIRNQLADLLGAIATPDSFVIDKHGAISYHGYIEDAPNPERSKNRALRWAIEAALQDRPAPVAETHARGCAIRRADSAASSR